MASCLPLWPIIYLNFLSLSLSLSPATFLAIIIFLSIAGNILVCVAIYTERSLRRIGNLFLASLAIADLFVASLVMTFAGVNDILGEHAEVLNESKCWGIFQLDEEFHVNIDNIVLITKPKLHHTQHQKNWFHKNVRQASSMCIIDQNYLLFNVHDPNSRTKLFLILMQDNNIVSVPINLLFLSSTSPRLLDIRC